MPVKIETSQETIKRWLMHFDEDSLAELLRREITANYPDIPMQDLTTVMQLDVTDMGVTVTLVHRSYS